MTAETAVGLALAAASTTLTNLAYLREHDAAAALPVLSMRRPLHSARRLLEDRPLKHAPELSRLERARKFRDESSYEVNSWEEFKQKIEEPGGFLWAHWDGTRETEDRIAAETKATIRCIPFDRKKEAGRCMVTGQPSEGRVAFASNSRTRRSTWPRHCWWVAAGNRSYDAKPSWTIVPDQAMPISLSSASALRCGSMA